MTTPRILIVAGSDSGGGAGIQADIKTVTMLGAHAITAITAITAQNTVGVQAVHPVPPDMVVAQMRSVIDDIGVDAVKIGMIGSAETAHAVAEVLEHLGACPSAEGSGVGNGCAMEPPDTPGSPACPVKERGSRVPIVFDPVMVATSGSILADADTVAAFGRLMRVATLVTPNLPELEALGGEAVIRASGAALLVKGGHGEGGTIVDRLIGTDGAETCWSDQRIDTRHTHGTGCTLASAVAEGLARGMDLPAAIARARLFVRLALHEAPGLGGGHGPMAQQRVRDDGLVAGLSLNQITLPARDHEESSAFWRAVGLRQIVDAPQNGYARFEADNGATLSTHVGDGAPGAVVYLEAADLPLALARLAAAGLDPLTPPQAQPWGWTEARFVDPAGNPLCLYQAGEYRRFPPWRLA